MTMTSTTLSTDFSFKLVLLGDTSVGKSSLVMRFVKDQFQDYVEATIGAAYQTKNVRLDDEVVTFQIWDTAGQERYHALAPMYYRGCAASIVVYDITNRQSFDRAQRWVDELLQNCGNEDVVIALVGNKIDKEGNVPVSDGMTDESDLSESDLMTDVVADQGSSSTRIRRAQSSQKMNREVPTDVAREWADAHKIMFFESSAKLNMNVRPVFVAIANVLVDFEKKKRLQFGDAYSHKVNGSFTAHLMNDDEFDKKSKCCAKR